MSTSTSPDPHQLPAPIDRRRLAVSVPCSDGTLLRYLTTTKPVMPAIAANIERELKRRGFGHLTRAARAAAASPAPAAAPEATEGAAA